MLLPPGGNARVNRDRLVMTIASPTTASINEENLRQAITITQQNFRAGVGQAGILDVGFIGNTSEVYPWEPSLIVDIDICLFVRRKDVELGSWLIGVREDLQRQLNKLGADFELKVTRGPYKPASWRLPRPVAIAHVAVFTEEGYAQQPLLLRWSWRKYRCVMEPARLSNCAGQPPDWPDLKELVKRKLARIQNEQVEMTEWELPAFVEVTRQFDCHHPVFAEYCLAGSLLCARTHARVLRRTEADRLPNRIFVEWYRQQVLDIAALTDLMRLKDQTHELGYDGLMPAVRDKALQYLGELFTHV